MKVSLSNPRIEGRNPSEIRIQKSERKGERLGRPAGFGFRPCFGSRRSAFGYLLLLVTLIAPLSTALGQGTAFTYQGSLQQNGTAVDGACDFTVSLWDAPTGGNPVGSSVELLNVAVNEGLFVLNPDVGTNVFDGSPRWIEIGVRHPAGSGNYTTLVPRQEITPTPVAQFAITGNEGPQGPEGPEGPQGPAGDSFWTEDVGKLYNTTDYIGLGTIPNVSARLDVDGTGAQAAIDAISDYAAPTITARNSGVGPALQLYSVQEANWFSGGAIQIGYTEGFNLGIDRNEIIARAGGAASPLYLNYDPSQPTGPVVIGSDLAVNDRLGIGLGTNDPTSRLDIIATSSEAHALEAESDHAVFPTLYARNAANGPVLWAESSEDASLTDSGAVVVGSLVGPNVGIDDNEIMARDNEAPATLYLNHEGGQINMGQHDIHPAFAYGVVSGAGSIISSSANVTSVSKAGAGHFDIHFAGLLADTDVVLVTPYGVFFGSAYVNSSGVLEADIFDSDGDPTDPVKFSFLVYRP